METIVKIYKENVNRIPKTAGFKDDKGNRSSGFYCGLLQSVKYETEPKAFFELLQIDQKIGWTNPAHVEYCVYKGIKIIHDQNVSFYNFNFFTKKICKFVFFLFISNKYYFQNWTKWCQFRKESLAHFSNMVPLVDVAKKNATEFGRISKSIFQNFITFSTKCENLGKWKIDEWAQMQKENGANSISYWIIWTSYLSGRFPLFYKIYLFC